MIGENKNNPPVTPPDPIQEKRPPAQPSGNPVLNDPRVKNIADYYNRPRRVINEEINLDETTEQETEALNNGPQNDSENLEERITECEDTAELIVETTDILIPRINAMLNDESAIEQYEAPDKKIALMKKKWAKFLEGKNFRLSPGNALLMTIGTTYGLDFASGIVNKVGKLIKTPDPIPPPEPVRKDPEDPDQDQDQDPEQKKQPKNKIEKISQRVNKRDK